MNTITPNNTIAVVVWYNPTSNEQQAVMHYCHDVRHVIIVDNSNTDNQTLSHSIPNSTYLPNKRNLGIAAALNIGCHQAVQLGAEWILTMDQDSLWKQWSVAQYINECNQYDNISQVAIFSPFHLSGGHQAKHLEQARFETINTVMCSGNLLRAQAWLQTGGFREDFFIDLVDDEINCHLRQLGWTIIRANAVALDHQLGNGVECVGPTHHHYTSHATWRFYYIGRNMVHMLHLYPTERKYYHHQRWKVLKRLFLYESTDKCKKIATFIRGWKDGLHSY